MVQKYFQIIIIFTVLACNFSNKTEKKVKIKADDITVLAALPEQAPHPANNIPNIDKIELGKLLFFDPILSGNKDVACASCHHPEFGFAESLDISIGVNGKGLGSKRSFDNKNDIPFVKRNSQTVLNTAFNGYTKNMEIEPTKAPMFWDLRAESLEKQALEPIKAFEEMRGHAFDEKDALPNILKRLQNINQYQILFEKAFGQKNAITIENLGKAIASYERTLIANNTRFDQYMRGDKTALSQNEIEGMMAFLKAGCAQCHNGPMFSDYKTHALGIDDNEKLSFIDNGFQKKEEFRTPSLRNLRFTFPYMHNGTIKTLENVLEFYEDLSGGKIRNQRIEPHQIDPLIKNLKLEFRDISSIVEFLNTLNDDHFDKSIPKKVPSGLKVGGNIY